MERIVGNCVNGPPLMVPVIDYWSLQTVISFENEDVKLPCYAVQGRARVYL